MANTSIPIWAIRQAMAKNTEESSLMQRDRQLVERYLQIYHADDFPYGTDTVIEYETHRDSFRAVNAITNRIATIPRHQLESFMGMMRHSSTPRVYGVDTEKELRKTVETLSGLVKNLRTKTTNVDSIFFNTFGIKAETAVDVLKGGAPESADDLVVRVKVKSFEVTIPLKMLAAAKAKPENVGYVLQSSLLTMNQTLNTLGENITEALRLADGVIALRVLSDDNTVEAVLPTDSPSTKDESNG